LILFTRSFTVNEMYKHAPLPATRTIRILVLYPSLIFNSPIQGTLELLNINTSNKGPYEALSYVWGSPNGDQPIVCDGDTLLVTPNCLSALRHLRRRWQTRTLWIDSICIDQTSIEEKNQQVALMGDVYKLAEKVVIWLGSGDVDISDMFQELRRASWLSTLPNKCKSIARGIFTSSGLLQ
jgi:Heterokaryon incompatibility protein (HET)